MYDLDKAFKFAIVRDNNNNNNYSINTVLT